MTFEYSTPEEGNQFLFSANDLELRTVRAEKWPINLQLFSPWKV